MKVKAEKNIQKAEKDHKRETVCGSSLQKTLSRKWKNKPQTRRKHLAKDICQRIVIQNKETLYKKTKNLIYKNLQPENPTSKTMKYLIILILIIMQQIIKCIDLNYLVKNFNYTPAEIDIRKQFLTGLVFSIRSSYQTISNQQTHIYSKKKAAL